MRSWQTKMGDVKSVWLQALVEENYRQETWKLNCSLCQPGTRDTELDRNSRDPLTQSVRRNVPEEMTFKLVLKKPEKMPDRAGKKQKAVATKA